MYDPEERGQPTQLPVPHAYIFSLSMYQILLLRATLFSRNHPFHATSKETEAQRGQVSYTMSHSMLDKREEQKPRTSGPSSFASLTSDPGPFR